MTDKERNEAMAKVLRALPNDLAEGDVRDAHAWSISRDFAKSQGGVALCFAISWHVLREHAPAAELSALLPSDGGEEVDWD